jgi:hypothetical protein
MMINIRDNFFHDPHYTQTSRRCMIYYLDDKLIVINNKARRKMLILKDAGISSAVMMNVAGRH